MSDAIDGLAARHARTLLSRLGRREQPVVPTDHPALAWRRASLMAVTGLPDGPGLVAPVALTSAANGALAALRTIAPGAALPDSGALLLGERAQLLELARRGAISANGTCRLLTTRSGTIALNLPRSEDWEMMPALFQAPAENWLTIERLALRGDRAELLNHGRVLGLGIAPDEPAPAMAPFTIQRFSGAGDRGTRPLVIDLSSLWAGPLAGSLLRAAGARVIKVESVRRPDGGRYGNKTFYDLLNAGKESVALDFSRAEDLLRLRRMIDRADIVIEASRPRALRALGIEAEHVAGRGAIWVSITAYGRSGDAAEWIGFGDDAAVAGGLSAAMARGWGAPLFAGDAIADPLTGITAALVAWSGWLQGDGQLISVPLADVVADACALYEAPRAELLDWQALAEADSAPLYPLRSPTGPARPLGADTAAVLAEFV